MQDMACPPGKDGLGGNCKCSESTFWNQGPWQPPSCHEGICYMGQTYDYCKGKDNGHPIDDKTWCWDEQKYTSCPGTPKRGSFSW